MAFFSSRAGFDLDRGSPIIPILMVFLLSEKLSYLRSFLYSLILLINFALSLVSYLCSDLIHKYGNNGTLRFESIPTINAV